MFVSNQALLTPVNQFYWFFFCRMDWKPVQKREIDYFQCGVCSQVCADFDEYSFHVNNSHEELLKPDINLLGIDSMGVESMVPE